MILVVIKESDLSFLVLNGTNYFNSFKHRKNPISFEMGFFLLYKICQFHFDTQGLGLLTGLTLSFGLMYYRYKYLLASPRDEDNVIL